MAKSANSPSPKATAEAVAMAGLRGTTDRCRRRWRRARAACRRVAARCRELRSAADQQDARWGDVAESDRDRVVRLGTGSRRMADHPVGGRDARQVGGECGQGARVHGVLSGWVVQAAPLFVKLFTGPTPRDDAAKVQSKRHSAWSLSTGRRAIVAWVCGHTDAVDHDPRERAVLGGDDARPLVSENSIAAHHTALIVHHGNVCARCHHRPRHEGRSRAPMVLTMPMRQPSDVQLHYPVAPRTPGPPIRQWPGGRVGTALPVQLDCECRFTEQALGCAGWQVSIDAP